MVDSAMVIAQCSNRSQCHLQAVLYKVGQNKKSEPKMVYT